MTRKQSIIYTSLQHRRRKASFVCITSRAYSEIEESSLVERNTRYYKSALIQQISCILTSVLGSQLCFTSKKRIPSLLIEKETSTTLSRMFFGCTRKGVWICSEPLTQSSTELHLLTGISIGRVGWFLYSSLSGK